jgi:peptidoglycan hydrolase CwlO-like protein
MKRLLAAAAILAILAPSIMTASVALAADAVEQREAELRQELERIEREKAEVQKVLDATRNQSASIERDAAILTAEIKQAQLKIQELNASIGKLSRDIDLKETTVAELDTKIENGKEGLAELIRTAHQVDDYTLPEILLANANLSDFFSEIDSYRTIQKALTRLFGDIRFAIADTQEQKADLSEKRERELDVKAEIEGQRRVIAAKEAEKKALLAASRQEEKGYESVIADKERQAQAIRTALFQLRDAGGIEFGQALEYAQVAGKATGVRPAFILAILKQETDLGKNVGTCNRAGDPPEKSWREIMPGPDDGDRSYRDDQTIFLELMEELGRDPDTTPLSCPWGNGWGGAMGPSQFIPTTWKAYSSRIEAALGVAIADPWNPKHAFTATAIYVADLGAGAQTYTAERTAALRYYAGSNWASPQNAFYGNQVMAHAEAMQKNIDFLDEVED